VKVFPDTNVLVAAFATRGLCVDLLRTVLAKHELVQGQIVLVELERVMRDTLRVPEAVTAAALDLLREYPVTTVDGPVTRPKCRDKDDAVVLACAIAAGADVLVTGDRDLLVLAGKTGVRIVDPRGLWSLLQGDVVR
jgi:putative PIN family toxin of toxin-antitoxin system